MGKVSRIQGLPREYPEHRAPIEPPSQGNLKAQGPEGVAWLSPKDLRSDHYPQVLVVSSELLSGPWLAS